MKTFSAYVTVKVSYGTINIKTQVQAVNSHQARYLLEAQYGKNCAIGCISEIKN